ncbi:MAG: c-type cytochrome [Polyangiaceae bacterium]|nr:c-type cytochrome [Polyangiaceae bacterium]
MKKALSWRAALLATMAVTGAGFGAAACSSDSDSAAGASGAGLGGASASSGGSSSNASSGGTAQNPSSGGATQNPSSGGANPAAAVGGVSSSAAGGTASAAGGATSNGTAPAKFALCAACHGATGEGTALAPEALHPDAAYAEWLVRNGMPARNGWMAMLAMDESVITGPELQEIIAFLNAPPRPTEGKAMYEDYCIHCHGSKAEAGGGGLSDAYIKGLDAGLFLEGVRKGDVTGTPATRNVYMPPFPSNLISDADVEKIRVYTQGL